jgi:YesN/AraC family two-component response regulator
MQYFANKLGLTSHYLGEIVSHFIQKYAIENIHEFVIKKAKQLLEQNSAMNNAEGAYKLGFEYPNYFCKYLKSR